MAKKKRPAQSNGYDDDDMRQLIVEIEELEAEKVSIRAKAAGECGGIGKRIATAKGRAKDLSIPLSILNGMLKTRKLERQIAAVGTSIPDDLMEVWVDASGQFAWLPPVEGEPSASPAKRAATKASATATENAEAEQAEGERILSELTH